MSLEPLHDHLVAKDISLADIYLDPNNPRFTGANWTYVSENDIPQQHHQDAAASRLIRDFAADKLRSNMEVNGFLPIDRVIVREFISGKYVVLEGNRRIAAAKTINAFSASGEKIADSVIESLKTIPCLVYTGANSDAAWIFQGLRHITGINDWSAYNKAKLLVEQITKEGLSQTDAGRRFGLTAFGAGQWMRGYFAFSQAKKETDYSAEVDENVYPYFQELFGRSSIAVRQWLEWSEPEKKFLNIDRLNEFVGWFYPRKGDEQSSEPLPSSLGKWEDRYIGRRDDIRQLAFLIDHSPKNFELFRRNHDVEDAYSKAQYEKYEEKVDTSADIKEKIFENIEKSADLLMNIPLSLIKSKDNYSILLEKIGKLQAAINFVKE